MLQTLKYIQNTGASFNHMKLCYSALSSVSRTVSNHRLQSKTGSMPPLVTKKKEEETVRADSANKTSRSVNKRVELEFNPHPQVAAKHKGQEVSCNKALYCY